MRWSPDLRLIGLCAFLGALWAAAIGASMVRAAEEPATALTAHGVPACNDLVLVQPAAGGPLLSSTACQLQSYLLTSVKAYGALCDGVTDDHVAIQAAITAVSSAGGVITFPAGTCYLGTVGLSITGNNVRLIGAGDTGVGSGGTTLLYGGTGSAITIGTTGAFNFNDGIDQLLITANATAKASATAVGLTLNNSQYFTGHNLGISYFQAGIGLLAQGNGATYYTASNSFYDPNFYSNHIGIRSTTINSGVGENVLMLFGGFVIGDTSVGSIGADLASTSRSAMFSGTDFESFATCINIAGNNARLMGTHTEFCTQHINLVSGATHNIAMGHMPESVASGPAVWADAGADNHYYGSQSGNTTSIIGQNSYQPTADTSGVIVLSNAAGLTYLDTDTRSASKAFELANGFPLLGFSDAFITQTLKLNAATGLANFYALNLQPGADGDAIFQVKSAGGTTQVDVNTTTAAVGLYNSEAIKGYSDSGSTQGWAFTVPSSGNGLLTVDGAGATTITLTGSNGHIAATAFNGALGDLTPSAATVTQVLATGAGGVGYATGVGAGGAVTQTTSRTTGVTLNKTTGAITLFSAAGSATATTFTVTDSAVAATDTIELSERSGTNLYNLHVTAVGAGSFNVTFYTTGGTATDAPVINFAVVKAAAS